MNKSNSIMEKIQEYQTPSTIVVELQNEGVLCASLDDTIESGGTIGSTTSTTSLFGE